MGLMLPIRLQLGVRSASETRGHRKPMAGLHRCGSQTLSRELGGAVLWVLGVWSALRFGSNERNAATFWS